MFKFLLKDKDKDKKKPSTLSALGFKLISS